MYDPQRTRLLFLILTTVGVAVATVDSANNEGQSNVVDSGKRLIFEDPPIRLGNETTKYAAPFIIFGDQLIAETKANDNRTSVNEGASRFPINWSSSDTVSKYAHLLLEAIYRIDHDIQANKYNPTTYTENGTYVSSMRADVTNR